MARLQITFTIVDRPDLGRLEAIGRDAWALLNLYRAGAGGCTPIDTPGPRWSHYIWKLRGMGVDIATITEEHGGPFSGTHARYVLLSPILMEAKGDAAEAAA